MGEKTITLSLSQVIKQGFVIFSNMNPDEGKILIHKFVLSGEIK